jgi:hypothetical protein
MNSDGGKEDNVLKVAADYLAGREFEMKWREGKGGRKDSLKVTPRWPSASVEHGKGRGHVAGTCARFPMADVVVVGLDIKEYSVRETHEQLALEIMLLASVQKALHILIAGGALKPDAPLCVTNTGDGMRVVFAVDFTARGDRLRRSSLEGAIDQAFAFVLTMNAMVSEDNERQPFRASDKGSLYPVSLRFAVTYGKVLILHLSEAGNRTVIGEPIVTSARILSSDSGNHLLMEEKLQTEVDRTGGMNAVCHGEWDQRFHVTTMREVAIKQSKCRFVDIFGHYSDAPLLRMLRRDPKGCRIYHIGSHDVSQVGALRNITH